MRSICVPAALAAAMSTAVPAYAAGEWPDGPNRLWFENLQRPDNHLAPERWTDPKSLYCCGIADTVKTKFKVEPGDGKHPDDRWYAWLKEEWGCDPGGKDRARLRTRWAGLPIPARRHDSMLRQAKGRTLEHGL
jgi:hypothetical protein